MGHIDYSEYISYIEDVLDALHDLKDALEEAEGENYDCEELTSGEVDDMIISVKQQIEELEELNRKFPTSELNRIGMTERDFF